MGASRQATRRVRQPGQTGARVWAWTRLALQLAFLGSLLGGSAWGVWLLSDPRTLPIQRVSIEGEFRHLTLPMLQAAAGPHARGGFFTVDVAAVRQAVLEVPWVAEVSVRRLWPETLRVSVREQVPVARWGEDGLMNAAGVVFHPPVETIPADLPRLDGPSGQTLPVWARYQDLKGRLRALGLMLQGLRLDQRRAWTLDLEGGVTILLGRADVEARLLRLMHIYPHALAADLERIAVVDARYTNGLAVRWKTGG